MALNRRGVINRTLNAHGFVGRTLNVTGSVRRLIQHGGILDDIPLILRTKGEMLWGIATRSVRAYMKLFATPKSDANLGLSTNEIQTSEAMTTSGFHDMEFGANRVRSILSMLAGKSTSIMWKIKDSVVKPIISVLAKQQTDIQVGISVDTFPAKLQMQSDASHDITLVAAKIAALMNLDTSVLHDLGLTTEELETCIAILAQGESTDMTLGSNVMSVSLAKILHLYDHDDFTLAELDSFTLGEMSYIVEE